VTLLFSRHPFVLQTSFAEIKRQAAEQRSVSIGSPGSVGIREVNGRRFYYRQFYDAEGKKAAEYIGRVGEAKAEARALGIRERISSSTSLARDVRILVQQGYVRADPRASAILGALANRGLFRAGAVLVGSHAYGALLNELGVRAAGFSTEDVDVARGKQLEVAGGRSFHEILAESTVRLLPVPGLRRGDPTTSYKARGSDRLRVDLLAPARGREVTIVAAPELRAHATALPYLGYLLEAPFDGVVLGRENVVPIRIPRAERFAWHKMLVSQTRSATSEKRNKDLLQASVLFAALVEDAPGAVEVARADLPRGTARSTAMTGAKAVLRILESAGHVRAAEAMGDLL
jgi:hypothetical protein